MEVTTCTIMYNASLDLLNIDLQDNYKFKERILGEQALLAFLTRPLWDFGENIKRRLHSSFFRIQIYIDIL